MKHILKEKFGDEKRWVNWRYVKKDGKLTKVPFGPSGAMAKSNDDTTWMTFKEATSHSENVGIMATPDQQTLLVDLDNCISDEGRVSSSITEKILEFGKKSQTYCELSPSGKGLHFFFTLTAPLRLLASKKTLNEKEKIECYTSGRFFTVTNNHFGKSRPVREISTDEAIALLGILGYPWEKGDTYEKQKELAESGAEAARNYVPSPLSLTDEQVLQKMFSSKNGKKLEALHGGDIGNYNNDDSAADMAFCDHLAFWTQGNAAQMEAIWLASPLGQRKKTQTRKDYRTRTITAAIQSCKEFYKPFVDAPIAYVAPMAEEKTDESPKSVTPTLSPDTLEFLGNEKGNVILIMENIARVLSFDSRFKGRFRFDTFRMQYEILDKGKWRTLEDNDALTVQKELSTLYPPFRRLTKAMAYDAIISVSRENSIDSAIDFIRGLKWDGVPRLDSWLSKTYGVEDDEYHRSVGSNWIKGMVMRLMEPGCKFDYVLVLEGPQGSRKSTSLYVLGGDWHVETTMTTDNKDFYIQFLGKSIIEFSEGETLSRTEVKRLKAIITMQKDRYRAPYERSSTDFPRRCVFAMTTNESEYLKDDTGNRRWLPVTLQFEEADVEWLKENRLQLFAEAHYRLYVKKESAYNFPKDIMKAAQQARKIKDPNADLVISWYYTELKVGDRRAGITVNQVHKVINGGYAHKAITKTEEMSIAAILREELRLEKRRVMIGDSKVTKWYPEDGSVDPMEGKEISVFDALREF